MEVLKKYGNRQAQIYAMKNDVKINLIIGKFFLNNLINIHRKPILDRVVWDHQLLFTSYAIYQSHGLFNHFEWSFRGQKNRIITLLPLYVHFNQWFTFYQ
jgi:hypothetical protein